MAKVFLIDADGVALKKHEYFSNRLARELNIPLETVLPFFKEKFSACSLGKADLKEVIAPFLSSWGWNKSVDELLEWWFTVENVPDQEVLAAVDEARKNGILCYLATDQEKYRAEHIRISIGNHFDGEFFSFELGVQKSDVTFFKLILSQIGTPVSEVRYLDDDMKNVLVAESIGIQSRLYEGPEDLTLIRAQ